MDQPRLIRPARVLVALSIAQRDGAPAIVPSRAMRLASSSGQSANQPPIEECVP